MTLLMMIGVSVVIGWMAQSRKERTGALYAFLTMVLLVGAWLFLFVLLSTVDPKFFTDQDAHTAVGFVVCVVVGLLMAIVVESLPKVRRKL